MPKLKRRATRKNPTRQNEWRKRQIVLPQGLVEKLDEWHGGQSTPTYALASSGRRNLVSLSMIDAALNELRSVLRSVRKPSDRKDLRSTLVRLSDIRHYWRENSAKEAGMEISANEYMYDRANYGMSEDEEAAIGVGSG